MTPMTMVKTQVYLPRNELKELHRVARTKHRRVAELIREAVRTVWLRAPSAGPVALFRGEVRGTAMDHDAAFDEL